MPLSAGEIKALVEGGHEYVFAVLGPLFRLPYPALGDARFVMQLYSVGIVLIFGTLALLYAHAWRQRGALQLSGDARAPLVLDIATRLRLEDLPLFVARMAPDPLGAP